MFYGPPIIRNFHLAKLLVRPRLHSILHIYKVLVLDGFRLSFLCVLSSPNDYVLMTVINYLAHVFVLDATLQYHCIISILMAAFQ